MFAYLTKETIQSWFSVHIISLTALTIYYGQSYPLKISISLLHQHYVMWCLLSTFLEVVKEFKDRSRERARLLSNPITKKRLLSLNLSWVADAFDSHRVFCGDTGVGVTSSFDSTTSGLYGTISASQKFSWMLYAEKLLSNALLEASMKTSFLTCLTLYHANTRISSLHTRLDSE
jgi:hypothetical protein